MNVEFRIPKWIGINYFIIQYSKFSVRYLNNTSSFSIQNSMFDI